MRPLRLEGQRFGMLTVIALLEERRYGKRMWRCVCDCGGETTVVAGHLRNGNTSSCGCRRSIHFSQMNRRHGLMDGTHPESAGVINSWKSMVQRCYNPAHRKYHLWGGAGVRMCEFLRASPANLLLLLGNRPLRVLSADRINTFGNYSCGQCPECLRCAMPFNIRWADARTQALNRRNSLRNRTITCL